MYELEYTKKAKEQLQKTSKDLGERIIRSLERIRIRPFSFVKRLMGSKYFRLRVGDYRLILDIQRRKLIILVIEIGHRRNIYKRI